MGLLGLETAVKGDGCKKWYIVAIWTSACDIRPQLRLCTIYLTWFEVDWFTLLLAER